MSTAVREAPHHNTLTCYTNYGCRLPECVERRRQWARERYRGLRAGTWPPLIDASPVRKHLQQLLDAGLTVDAIAGTAGVTRESIATFEQSCRAGRGRRQRTYPEFAKKILAVTPDNISSGRVDATGTHRRIQALVAAGWPLLHIGTQFDMHPQRPEQILRCKRVYAATRQQIADGYERVILLRPERRGVTKDKARLSRERAQANRWPNPAYWADRMDDIDDPHFEPMYGITRREIVAKDANWIMRTAGLTKAATAERLGVDKSYVDHALRDHPEGAAA